jgi:hypothetical protein
VGKEKSCTQIPSHSYGAADTVYSCKATLYGFPSEILLIGLNGKLEGGWVKIPKAPEKHSFRVKPGYLIIDDLRNEYDNPANYGDLAVTLNRSEAYWFLPWGRIYVSAKAEEAHFFVIYLSSTLVAAEKKRLGRN